MTGDCRFGEMLRVHRVNAALTQEELAESAALSVRTIRNLESGAIRSPRLRSVRTIADALELGGDERLAFEQAAGLDLPLPVRAAANHRIPAPIGRLVGRDHDIRSICGLLAESACRMITLTGMAGVGKSRLAMAIAHAARDGGAPVWWVPLSSVGGDEPEIGATTAPTVDRSVRHWGSTATTWPLPSVGDRDLVIDAVAAAVGASTPEPEAIAAVVHQPGALLVVDNLEHLDGADGVLNELLAAAPETTVLGTSRAPIGAGGEHVWIVTPLAYPADDVVGRGVLDVPSVQLLADRWRAADPRTDLTDAACLEIMAAICRQLDGLPLALELAARQARVLGLAGVLAAIRDRPLDLRALGSERPPVHASLRAALGASSQLLTPAQRAVYEQLSVFRGGWTFDAATEVVDGDVLACLDRIVALGLAETTDDDGDRRFSMLHIVRAFASEQARASGRDEDVAKRHADHYAALAARLESALMTADAFDALHRLDRERDNLRAALAWYERHDPDVGISMATGLWWYWQYRRRNDEGIEWYRAFLAHDVQPVAAVHARSLMASLAHFGNHPEALSMAEHAVSAAREVGDPTELARALAVLGAGLRARGRPGDAESLTREALRLADSVGDPGLMVYSRIALASALCPSRRTEVDALNDEALELTRANGFAYYEVVIRYNMAVTAFLGGDNDLAGRCLHDGSALLPTPHPSEMDVLVPAMTAIVAATRGALPEAEASCRRAVEALAPWGEDAPRAAPWVRAVVLLARAETCSIAGRPATDSYARAIAVARESAERPVALLALAGAAAAADDAERAAAAWVAARRLVADMGISMPFAVESRLDAVTERWATRLDPTAWQQHVREAHDADIEALIDTLCRADGPAPRLPARMSMARERAAHPAAATDHAPPRRGTDDSLAQ